ncbi:MAG TPA: hypothetical protein VK577_17345 [Bradyrhizobium sp.]|nr:hypothetical protein [Bradyrhizobium sp.]
MARLFSGLCEGGPLGGLKIHHGEPLYYVARDRETKRIRIRNLAYETDVYEVGHYEFIVDTWHWRSPLRTLDETDPLV